MHSEKRRKRRRKQLPTISQVSTTSVMDHEKILLSCPFCEFSDYDSSFLGQHVELCHPEDEDLPSNVMGGDGGDSIDHSNQEDGQNTQCDSPNAEQERQYMDCPEGCGELVPVAELPLHMDLHMAENFALEDSSSVGMLASSEPKTVDSPGSMDKQESYSDIQPKTKPSHRRRVRRSKESGTKESASSTKGGSIRKLGVMINHLTGIPVLTATSAQS